MPGGLDQLFLVLFWIPGLTLFQLDLDQFELLEIACRLILLVLLPSGVE